MKLNLNPLALVFIVKDLGPHTGGVANGPVVRLLEKYTEDKGILAHELEHVSQFWHASFISMILLCLVSYILGWMEPFQFNLLMILASVAVSVHSLGYLLYRPYRYWCEASAYRVQLEYSTDKVGDAKLFASFLTDYYNLKTTEEEALNQLNCK